METARKLWCILSALGKLCLMLTGGIELYLGEHIEGILWMILCFLIMIYDVLDERLGSVIVNAAGNTTIIENKVSSNEE